MEGLFSKMWKRSVEKQKNCTVRRIGLFCKNSRVVCNCTEGSYSGKLNRLDRYVEELLSKDVKKLFCKKRGLVRLKLCKNYKDRNIEDLCRKKQR